MGTDTATVSQETLVEFQTLYQKFKGDMEAVAVLHSRYDIYRNERTGAELLTDNPAIDQEGLTIDIMKVKSYQRKIIDGRFYKVLAYIENLDIECMQKMLKEIKKFEAQRKRYQSQWKNIESSYRDSTGSMTMGTHMRLVNEHFPIFQDKLESSMNSNKYLESIRTDLKASIDNEIHIGIHGTFELADETKYENYIEGILKYQGTSHVVEDIRTVFEILHQNPQYVLLMIEEISAAQSIVTSHTDELKRVISYLDGEEILDEDIDEDKGFLEEIRIRN